MDFGEHSANLDSSTAIVTLLTQVIANAKKVNCPNDLDEAISLLNYVIQGNDDTETRAIAKFYLLKGLVTRFAWRGWVEDLETCQSTCDEATASEHKIIVQQWAGTRIGRLSESVERASRFIQAHRRSIDLSNLNISVWLGRAALRLLPMSRDQRRRLHMLMGDTLILKYMSQNQTGILDTATAYFRDAEGQLKANDPLVYIRAISLAHIGWIRFVEWASADGFQFGYSYITQAQVEDAECSEAVQETRRALSAKNEQQLDRAIILLSSSLAGRKLPHPRRRNTLATLAAAYSSRYRSKGYVEDMLQAVSLSRMALQITPPPHPERYYIAGLVAQILLRRFEKKGDVQDLDDLLMLKPELLASTKTFKGSEAVRASRNSMIFRIVASSLLYRFEHTNSSSDLEESILLSSKALSLLDPNDSDRIDHLCGLADALYARFINIGELSDLNRSVSLYQEVIAMSPSPSVTSDLARALCTRFEWQGGFQDMELGISLQKQALAETPSDSPTRKVLLNNLAGYIHTRFRHKGDFHDLEESIKLSRESYALAPARNQEFHVLPDLPFVLFTRFMQKKDILDLEESIALLRELVATFPDTHPMHRHIMANLGSALHRRYLVKQESRDLEESSELGRQVIKLLPRGHPDRTRHVVNLANVLLSKSDVSGDSGNVEEAMGLYQEAMRFMEVSHPERGSLLANIATASYRAFLNTQDSKHLDDAINYFKMAAKSGTGSLVNRLEHCDRWAQFSMDNGRPHSAMQAYSYAISLLPLLSSLDLTLTKRQNVLVHATSLSSNAVRCAIEVKDFEAAVVIHSTARSTFWSQELQLRTPIDNLRLVNRPLANAFRAISQQLEDATHGGMDIMMNSNPAIPHVGTYSLAQERDRLLKQIRAEGFEDFLQPPSFQTLKKAADNGPIVFLNAHTRGCDAIIMQPGGSLMHIPLDKVPPVFEFLKHGIQTDGGTGERDVGQMMVYPLVVALMQTSQQLMLGEPISLRDAGQEGAGPSRLKGKIKGDTKKDSNDNFVALLAMLWSIIAEPVIGALGLKKTKSPKRIWWCPAGEFALLPIHAAGLHKREGTLDCLFDYVVSSYCYSPQDLLAPPLEVPSDFKLLAIIEPESPMRGAGPLPKTLVELDRIQSLIPSPKHLIKHIGSRKSPTNSHNVLKDLKDASFVHFGCHGLQHATNPLESCLLLSDGKLTMARLIRECQTSKASLAYLSACQTAMGDVKRPDESLTLAATMMFAGFKSVVGTMWSIHDEDAPVVSEVFYRYLFRHGSQVPPSPRDAAFALHLAVAELRAQGKDLHRWVPFVHFGI
ncbi:hypothetical protein FA15DRAFT_757682 [Coprinopsis marcescibilis]|uniref:CHAT domain-containing protein n=1 Tax=Coprinopsis marcescibilis TaxID=230819 RepID=A0A5C3KSS8_COPMA|nr:hypothetical protein FA15DRAFT_757682 [Coprinopsis marcescibilis]